MSSLGWLFVSDLHIGTPGMPTLWPHVEDELRRDLERVHRAAGPFDFVLCAGDLVQTGAREELDAATEKLEGLFAHLASLGSTPALLVVPGNHDLVRPDERSHSVRPLLQWSHDPELRGSTFWHDVDGKPHRDVIDGVFAEYVRWLRAWNEAHPLPAGWTRNDAGLLPGDFAATFRKDGLSLGVVGLNSAFPQLTPNVRRGAVAIHPLQLHTLCGDPRAWTSQHDVDLLLSHHSPVWFTPDATARYQTEIFRPEWFAAHFCGHMHESQTVPSQPGSAPSRVFQSPSLLGLEQRGGARGEGVPRAHGYSAVRLSVDEERRAILRFFPRVVQAQKGAPNRYRIIPNHNDFDLDDDSGFTFELGARPPAPAAVAAGLVPSLRPSLRNPGLAAAAAAAAGATAGAPAGAPSAAAASAKAGISAGEEAGATADASVGAGVGAGAPGGAGPWRGEGALPAPAPLPAMAGHATKTPVPYASKTLVPHAAPPPAGGVRVRSLGASPSEPPRFEANLESHREAHDEADDLETYVAPEPPGLGYNPRWYVPNEAKEQLILGTLRHPGAPVVVTAPPFSGKSTVLQRIVARLREDHRGGVERNLVLLIDLGSLGDNVLADPPAFFLELGEMLVDAYERAAREARLPAPEGSEEWVTRAWQRPGAPETRLTSLLERRILPGDRDRLVLALDRADRFVGKPCGDPMARMLRQWVRAGALGDPLWEQFRLLLAAAGSSLYFYAPDAVSELFASATHVRIERFGLGDVRKMAKLYQGDWTDEELARLVEMVDGQPYLSRMILFLERTGVPKGELLEVDRLKIEHCATVLRQVWLRIAEQPDLRKPLCLLLRDPATKLTTDEYHRLYQAGLVRRDGASYVLPNKLVAGYIREQC